MRGELSRPRRRKRIRIKWKRFFFAVGLLILALTVMLGTAAYVFMKSLNPNGDGNFTPGDDNTPVIKSDRQNFLIMGTDAGTIGASANRNRYRTDVMLLASINMKTGRVNIISIPRDTRVEIPGKGINKINAAHAFGGPELAIKTVENFLHVKIDHYVTVNYNGFIKIIDILGGVDINVDTDLKYVDRAGGLYIDIKKGPQHLNGSDALGYVRFRHDNLGDIGRIKRQQKFLSALAEQVFRAGTIAKIPKITEAIAENVVTDMTPGEMVSLASKVLPKFASNKLITKMIPGTDPTINGVSYWVPDAAATRRLVQELCYDPVIEGNKDVKIEVQNGNGQSGAATQIADALEISGYTIIKTANADRFDYEKSQIINYMINDEEAKKISKVLENSEIVDGKPEDKGEADIVIIVGSNFN